MGSGSNSSDAGGGDANRGDSSSHRSLANRIFGIMPSDLEEQGRRKLFIICVFIVIVPFIGFGTYHVSTGMHLWGATIFAATAVLLVLLLRLKHMANPKPAYRVALSTVYAILMYWSFAGTVSGFGSLWVLTTPPFTFFMIGRREGLVWTLSLGVAAAFILFNPFSLIPTVQYPLNYSIRLMCIFVLILLITYFYETARMRFRNAMLREEEELRAARDGLEIRVTRRTEELQKKNIDLEQSERRYKLLADNINDLIWSLNLDMNLIYISPSVERMLGYTVDEAMKFSRSEWLANKSYAEISKAIEEQLALEREGELNPENNITIVLQQIHKSGEVIDAEATISFIRDESGKPIGIVGVTWDITERVRSEKEKEKMHEQLAQAQKMEAIGALVAGIAHDFNNNLMGIVGSFNMIQRALERAGIDKTAGIGEYLKTGTDSSQRSADLIRQLLSLSKKHEVALAPLDINVSLQHIQKLCKTSLPKSVVLKFNLRASPLMTMGDMAQVEQVLLNICINASHAMTTMRPVGAEAGGVLTVAAEETDSDEIAMRLFGKLKGEAKKWVRIRISDNGVGMSDEVQRRIFEPFFTTKKEEGTGLGLSTSYNIIKKHGGAIHVDSQPGVGSCFSLYFPAVQSDEGIASVVAHGEELQRQSQKNNRCGQYQDMPAESFEPD